MPSRVSGIPHRRKGGRLIGSVGEYHVMAQPIVKRVLISSLINKNFPVRHLPLAHGNFASVKLNSPNVTKSPHHSAKTSVRGLRRPRAPVDAWATDRGTTRERWPFLSATNPLQAADH